MADTTRVLLCLALAALAKTWDDKLPGYKDDFAQNLDKLYFMVPPTEADLRDALDELRAALGKL